MSVNTLCAGCQAPLPVRSGRGAPRKWCSESCRISTYHYGSPAHQTKTCDVCDAPYRPARRDQMRCSTACATAAISARRVERQDRRPVTPRACLGCGEIWTPKPNNAERARYCSAACINPVTATRYLARRAAVTVEDVNPWEVWERDGWTCGICHEPIERDLPSGSLFRPSVDHVIPLSLGGEHSMANVQAAHVLCNRRKGNRIA